MGARGDRGVTCWGDHALDVPADLAAGDALTLKVQRVLERYEAGGDAAACGALDTLVGQLGALTGKKVGDTEALRTALVRIRTFLGCAEVAATGHKGKPTGR